MAKNHKNIGELAIGGFDGQVIIWNLQNKKPTFNIKTPHNTVKSLTYSNNAEDLLTYMMII